MQKNPIYSNIPYAFPSFLPLIKYVFMLDFQDESDYQELRKKYTFQQKTEQKFCREESLGKLDIIS